MFGQRLLAVLFSYTLGMQHFDYKEDDKVDYSFYLGPNYKQDK